MQSHGPKRVYTPGSLEFWFGKLEGDWAPAFTAEQLERGRQIYVEGQVRELELTDHDAIVHRRVEKRDEYAVIEWTEQGISVRSSSTDPEVAQALAVAGLHEIEELVADEISPLPADSRPPFRTPPRSAPEPGATGPVARPAPAAAVPAPATPATGAPSRTLVLVFKTRTSGLTFQAVWNEGHGGKRLPALGPEAQAAGHAHPTSAERAKLIGLAAYARKAHFHYQQDTGLYLLESLIEIPNFLRTVLPAWKRLFTVELDDKAANLLKGTRTVEIEAVAEAAPRAGGANGDGVGLNLRWIFRAGERMLTDSEVAALLRKEGQPVILPNLGIVAVPAEKWATFATWQRSLGEAAGEDDHAPLSPYLIFSLFNDDRLKLSLSPEIAAWRERVLGAPPPPPP
ncbi:MAG: ATP-dependent helicase, partial [Opitutaceae bacterium]